MKRILFVLMLTLLTGGMAMAQNERRSDAKMDPKVRAEHMTERMAKKYSLNETQKKQLFSANLALAEKMGDMPMHRMRKKSGMKHKKCCCCEGHDKKMKKHLTKEERVEMKTKMDKKRAEMRTEREAYDAQLQKIMTKEQYSAYSSKKGPRRARALNGD